MYCDVHDRTYIYIYVIFFVRYCTVLWPVYLQSYFVSMSIQSIVQEHLSGAEIEYEM